VIGFIVIENYKTWSANNINYKLDNKGNKGNILSKSETSNKIEKYF